MSNQRVEIGELSQSVCERKRIGRIENPESIRDYEKTDVEDHTSCLVVTAI
jgi:hypothetical protein